jgi:hypothetical protein
MFTTRRISIVAALFVAMVLEWLVASGWGRASTAHYFHGLCNGGVGWPYADFIHRLRVLSDTGDTQRLNQALQAADKRSHDMFKVWLYDKEGAYRQSLDETLP